MARERAIVGAFLAFLATDARAEELGYVAVLESWSSFMDTLGTAQDNPTYRKVGSITGILADVGKVGGKQTFNEKVITGSEIATARAIRHGAAEVFSNAKAPIVAVGSAVVYVKADAISKIIVGPIVEPYLTKRERDAELERMALETEKALAATEAASRIPSYDPKAVEADYERAIQAGRLKRGGPLDVSTYSSPSWGGLFLNPKQVASPPAGPSGSSPSNGSPSVGGVGTLTSSRGAPEWQSITVQREAPNVQYRGVPQQVLTPRAQSAASPPKEPPPQAKVATNTAAPDAGGVRTGASTPAVSATALPEGGIRVAPPASAGANASSGEGGLRTGSSSPIVSATALPEGGVRVAPSLPASAGGSLTASGDNSAASYNLPKPTPTGVGTSAENATGQGGTPTGAQALAAAGTSQTSTKVAPSNQSGTASPTSADTSRQSVLKTTPSNVHVQPAQSRQTGSASTTAPSKPSSGGSYNVALASPSNNPVSNGPSASAPGGISLNKAAAEKLSLNLDFDGAFFTDGQIVLSGRPQATGIDASLFLTALRLACEPGDPFFSLDPDNGQAWSDEGQSLSKIVGEKVRSRFDPRSLPSKQQKGLNVSVLSARTDLGAEWQRLLSSHPNFKTRLVFRPEWLRQTRFGEILFKADVLLKELTAGAPTVRSEPILRAATIDKYVPSDARSAARSLLESIERQGKANDERPWRGHRLWFDLVAQTAAEKGSDWQQGQPDAGFPVPQTNDGAALFRALKQRDYVADGRPNLVKASVVVENRGAVDLSQVYPQMFVRRFDHASSADLPGHDPDLDLLSADVNQRTAEYAAAYKELRDLTDIFRAYIVASKYAKRYPNTCSGARTVPLLSSEKTEKLLPDYYPSELFVTVATFETARGWSSIRGYSVNGGISLRGKLFSEQRTTIDQSTPVTVEVKQEVDIRRQESVWKAPSGRQFVSLKVGPEDWVAPSAEKAVIPEKVTNIPAISGSIGRFDIFEDARITGNKLKSSVLVSKYLQAPNAAMEECAQFCSADSNCVAFEIDQSQDRCQTYSTVLKAQSERKWTHGVWR